MAVSKSRLKTEEEKEERKSVAFSKSRAGTVSPASIPSASSLQRSPSGRLKTAGGTAHSLTEEEKPGFMLPTAREITVPSSAEDAQREFNSFTNAQRYADPDTIYSHNVYRGDGYRKTVENEPRKTAQGYYSDAMAAKRTLEADGLRGLGIDRVANRAAQAAVNAIGSGIRNVGNVFGADTSGIADWQNSAVRGLQSTDAGRQNAAMAQARRDYTASAEAFNRASSDRLAISASHQGDFTTYSKYDPNKGNDKDFDLVYEQVNGTRRYQNAALEDAASGNPFRPRIDHNYSQLTNDERAVYNYYYNTGDKERAQAYLDSIYPELEKRRYEADTEFNRQYATEHPVAASVVSPALGAVSGIAAIPGIAEQISTGRVNPYSEANSVLNTSQQYRNTVAENIAKSGTFGANAASFLYQTGMDFLESTIRASLLGGIGGSVAQGLGATAEGVKAAATTASLVPMALGVYQSTSNDMKLKGYSDSEAQTIGAVAAGAEYLTEKLPLEKLYDTFMASSAGTKTGFLRGLGKQFVTEGGEEGISDLINWAADILLLGDRSEWSNSVKEYQAQGATRGEAIKSAFIDKTKEIGLDILGGGLSGAASHAIAYGGGALIGKSVNAAANSQTAKAAEEVKAKAEQIKGEVKAASAMTAEEWEASRKDQSDAAKKRRAAVRESGASLGVSEDMIRSVEAASDVTGQSVTFKSLDYDSLSDEQKKNISREDFGKISLNGYRNDTTGEIVLNSNAKTEEGIKFILGHELGHSIEGGKLWTQLRDLAYEYYARNGKDWNKEARDLLAELEFVGAENFDQDSEMTANFAGKFLLDNVDSIEWLVNSNHGMATRVWNWINEKLATRFADDETATKAVLTRARELYGRALAANAAAANAGEESARTLPTANAQAQQTQTTAPAAVQQTQTTQTAESAEPTGEGALSAMPAPGMMPTAAQADASGEMSEYQQRAAELARERDSGEISQEGYEEELESLDNEYQRDPLAAYHEDMREAGLENERGERTYSITPTAKDRETVKNEKPVNAVDEVRYSITFNDKYQEDAVKRNKQTENVPESVLENAGRIREIVRNKLLSVKDEANLPEDKLGNTAFGNSAYGTSEENTSVCIRSLAIDSLTDLVAEELGRPLTVEESVFVAQEAFNYTDMPQCLYCYVAMDRMAKRELLGEYINKRDAVIENLRSGMSEEDALSVFKASETSGGKQWSPDKEKRFKSWVKAFKSGSAMLQMSDLASEASVEAAMKNPDLAKQAKDAVIYAQSASWAKKRVAYAAYNGHILKWSQNKIDALNSMFGLRMYSFSDYSPAFVLENMQMITDAAVRGLKMLAYTKDLDFVRVFADTGMNINISVFGMNGENGEVHQDGMQGANWEEAQALRAQHPNVGITFVATSDAQVDWALDQDWIDVVIPFHMVKTGARVAAIFGYHNYTGESSDRKLQGATKKEIYPDEHQNDREKYFAALKEANLEPRFERWKDHKNYMRLVNETRRSAQDTPAVQPVFNLGAALNSIDGMVKRGGYNVPIGGNLDVQKEIAEEFAGKIAEGMAENLKIRNGVIVNDKKAKFSVTADDDEAYLSAARSGDTETAQRMVDEAARRAGYEKYKYNNTENINPNSIAPRNGIYRGREAEVNDRAAKMVEWVGRPILAYIYGDGYQAITGSHRIYIARKADIDVKAVVMSEEDISDLTEYLENSDDGYDINDFLDYLDEDQQAEILKGAVDDGYDNLKDAYTILAVESESNNSEHVDQLVNDPYIRETSKGLQVKSADPITYDDNGAIIPLSERFNPENKDIRYSVTDNQLSLDNSSESEYNTLASDPRVVWGSAGRSWTSDNEKVPFRYAIVPPDTLIVSNDEYGDVNPDYPKELQPRDRTRVVSVMDVNHMTNTLNPERLAESANAGDGAPIIRGDGVVVGGNKRVMSILNALKQGKAGEYESYIRDNAERFGIEGDVPEDGVLVRIAESDDWADLAKKLNESTTGAYSTTEQAQIDADRLDNDILSLLSVNEDGDLNTAANRDFISSFIENVAGESERAALVNADGYLSQQGLRRVQAAVFAKAYGDASLIARMSESLDDDMKNVTKALMQAASKAAVTANNIANGDAYDLDVTNEIIAGVELYAEAKKQKTDIDDIAGQMSLDEQKYGDAAIAVAKYIAANKLSGAKIADLFNAVYTFHAGLGSPNQAGLDLFGEGADNSNVTVSEIFRSAARRLLDESEIDIEGNPKLNIGFKIEDIGEQTSLPRNLRKGEAESINGNGNNTSGDVQESDGRRAGTGRAPGGGRNGRVILPTGNSTPDSGRYIDRNSESFGDIIREEAAKLGMIEPAAGKQMGIGGDADRILRNAEFSSKVSQRRADAEAREIKAEANAEGKEIIANSREVGKAYEAVGKEKGDRLVRNAQFSSAVMQRQAKAESKEIKAGAEAESKEILANAREAGKAYEAVGKEKGERKGLHAQIVGEMRGGEAIRKGEEKGAAKIESATEKANAIFANAQEVDQAYKAIEKDKEQARRDARKAAADRKANRDITVPASNDVNGQREMFQNLYQSQKKYKSATASKWMTASDMAKLRDLMAGTISAEYDLVGSDHPKMIREAFEALLEYDKAGRTVDAYGEQVRRELRETAAEKLKNSNSFKDKNYGFKYSRETERRNIRDIAPAEDAEAINQEYFYPVMKAARKKDSLLRKYNGRVKALGISQKVLKGNKVSEAYAVQLLGEIRAIKRELERATDTFMSKTAPGKIAKYGQTSTELDTSGSDLDAVLDEMGVPDPRKEKGQKGAKKGRIAGLTADEQSAMETMSQGEFSDYIMSKAPKKYGMTLAEYEALEQKFIKENPNLDYAAVDRKIDGMRGIYDELENQLNETYMRWGYPPLGHIEGYFPHFINDSGNVLQKMGKRLGLSSASLQLPTEIVGQTAERKPGVKWFANKLTRNTNVTDYDAIEGYARYIEGATDVIAFTESIQKLRAYVNEIRYKNSDKAVQEEVNAIMRDKTKSLSEKYFDIEQRFADLGTDKYALNNYVQNVTEYTNNLAGKKSLLDRGMEGQLGRNALYRGLNAYNRLRAMSAVSMNITSALTNIIPIAQVTGVAGIGNTAKAFGDTIVNMFSKGDGLREMSDFLMTREGVTPVNQTGFEKAIDAAGILFNLLDRLGSETVWRANYYNNKKAGLSTEAAAAKADIEADETISGRYKGARPTLFNSQNPIVQMGTRFVQEANNFISYALKDVPRERRDRKKNVLLGEAVMFFFLWLYNEGFQALFGRRPAQEPSELVNDIAGDITGYRMPNVFRLGGALISEKRLPTAEDFKTEKGDLVKDVTSDVVDILPFSGWAKLLSDVFGFDLNIQGGRFEIGDSVPDFGRLKTAGDQWQVWAEELSKPVTSLIPGGNQIQKTVKGAATMIAGGSYKINDKGERQLQYPAEQSAGNWARAIIAGKSSLPTAQEWVEKGFDTLSVKDTEIYDMLTGYDVKPDDALGLIKSLNAIQKTDEESRSKLQRKALIDSDIDQTAKLMLYYGKFAGDKEKALIDEIGGSSGDALLKAIDGCKNSSTQGGDIKAIIGSSLSGNDKVTMYDDYVLDKDSRERAAIEAVRNGEDGNALMKLIDGVKSAVKTDEESAAKQKRDLLVNSSLSGESKLTLYTDSGLFGASEKEIEILKSLSGSADNDELTKAAARLKLSAKGYDDTLALMEASLPRDAKKELYLGLCVDADGREKKASQISDITGAGLNFDDYLKIANKYYELNDNKDIKAGAKATEFSYWLDGQRYTDRQKAAAQEAFGYYSQVRAKPSGYEKMTDTGLSADAAYEINRQISALEPKPGKSQVSDTQKAQVIVSQQGLTDEEKLSALRSVYSEDSNTNYSKAYVAVSYGVPLETYYKVIDRCLEVDDDPQYASYKPQERARAVIDSFGELTNRQKAAIWQCYTVNWSAKSNPFDQSVGAYVHSLYYESDGKTRKDIMPGNLPRQASSSSEAAASSSGGSSSRTAAEALTSGTMPTASQISGSSGRSAGSALAGALSGRR